MCKKLAITVAGAVSLGSYEAGVLYEFLDAIAQHNQDEQTSEADRIEVDVLTGASAGGMTAIILAQKLLYAGDEFKGPYDNPLYNTWVLVVARSGDRATTRATIRVARVWCSVRSTGDSRQRRGIYSGTAKRLTGR